MRDTLKICLTSSTTTAFELLIAHANGRAPELLYKFGVMARVLLRWEPSCDAIASFLGGEGGGGGAGVFLLV